MSRTLSSGARCPRRPPAGTSQPALTTTLAAGPHFAPSPSPSPRTRGEGSRFGGRRGVLSEPVGRPTDHGRRHASLFPPLPACGERVGVRGRVRACRERCHRALAALVDLRRGPRSSRLVQRSTRARTLPPHPHPLPARGERGTDSEGVEAFRRIPTSHVGTAPWHSHPGHSHAGTVHPGHLGTGCPATYKGTESTSTTRHWSFVTRH